MSDLVPAPPAQEMQTTLEKEQKADEDMYAELRGWCKDDLSSVGSIEVRIILGGGLRLFVRRLSTPHGKRQLC